MDQTDLVKRFSGGWWVLQLGLAVFISILFLVGFWPFAILALYVMAAMWKQEKPKPHP